MLDRLKKNGLNEVYIHKKIIKKHFDLEQQKSISKSLY